MAAYTVTAVTAASTTPTSNTAAASDTVAVDSSGGLLLTFLGGAGSDTITITDSGLTPAGTAASASAIQITLPSGATNIRSIKIPSAMQNSSGLVTVAHSAPSGVVVLAQKIYPPF